MLWRKYYLLFTVMSKMKQRDIVTWLSSQSQGMAVRIGTPEFISNTHAFDNYTTLILNTHRTEKDSKAN